jgi:hypothetical protein
MMNLTHPWFIRFEVSGKVVHPLSQKRLALVRLNLNPHQKGGYLIECRTPDGLLNRYIFYIRIPVSEYWSLVYCGAGIGMLNTGLKKVFLFLMNLALDKCPQAIIAWVPQA